MAMLEVRDLQVYYGMIHAIKGISFDVNQGEVIALIGANGAGKTTTLHTITGLLAPKSGSVLFEGKDITKVPAHKIVSMGMAHVPEGRRVFAELSVYENLKMGAYTRKDKKEIEESLANVYKRFPRLEERKNQMAGTLSGGEQQMLAMGRALMSKPKIILMDEPSMGLSPIFVNEIFDIIRAVSESGTTVLLVEQNAKKALSIADRAYVLETGHPEIIRYFMTIPEACRLVLEAGTMGNGGEIFVFDMGQPVKIADLAQRMIELSGMKVGKDIEIEYTGLRPGEKLYEELLSHKENTKETLHEKIRIADVREYNYQDVEGCIEILSKLSLNVEIVDMVRKMKSFVPEFKSQNSEFEKLDL